MSFTVSPWNVADEALNETRGTCPLKMLVMIGKPLILTEGRAERWNELSSAEAIFDSATRVAMTLPTTNRTPRITTGASSQRTTRRIRSTPQLTNARKT